VAAGLRAGVPAVPVPVDLDQPFWAQRVVALGAAPDWVPAKKLTADRLAAALRAAVGEERYRARAAEVAAQLATEDGAGRTVEAVGRVIGAPVAR
jgi:UDP:flavonoid glycosyltransferase YjiC (YdhE family)